MNSIRPHILSTDHYGLVVSTCKYFGIEELIDKKLGLAKKLRDWDVLVLSLLIHASVSRRSTGP